MNAAIKSHKAVLAGFLVALLLGTPLATLANGSPIPPATAGSTPGSDFVGPVQPDAGDGWDFWHNGSFGGDDQSLLRMLAHVGAMPDTSAPVASHALGVNAPPQVLPALYEAHALSSATPLRDAVLAYHGALDLLEPAELHQNGDLHAVDDMPHDIQVAIAVLLYALADASLLQKEAVSGLSPQEYTQLVAVPGAIHAGRLDPSDDSRENRAAIDAVTKLLAKVDKSLIDDAGMITTHAVAHAMPTLRAWSEREQTARNDPHVQAIDALVGPYTPQRIAAMDPIERLSILAETLHTVAGIQGTALGAVEPLPAPDGDNPLRAAVLDLVGALGGSDASGVVVDEVLEAELTRADQLPHSMQVAAARIVANQAGLLRAQLDLHAADFASGDAGALARAVREAEVRVVMAVQESAPTLEAWGILWSHYGQSLLPVSPADAPGKLGDAARLGQGVTDAQADLQEVMQMAGQVNGLSVSAAEAPPLPPRGALGDAVLSLYARYGIVVEDAVRDDIAAGAQALPPEVERNAARILLAQLDALGTVEETQAMLSGQADPDRATAAAAAVERLLTGEPVGLEDVQALRAHYAAMDEAQTAMLDAAATLAAALDASAHELEVWAGYVRSPEPEFAAPDSAPSKPWYKKAWSAVKGFQVIGTASAQSIPGEPNLDPVSCPAASPLAYCDDDGDHKDVWFMDPLLETVVVSGFRETTFDSGKMGIAQPNAMGPVYPRGQMLTLDLGGRDTYRNNAGGSSPAITRPIDGTVVFAHPTAVSVALDLNGDDEYEQPVSFPSDNMPYQNGGILNPSTSTTSAPGGVQGAAVGGLGILWDRRGNDSYEADEEAQGYGGGVPILMTPAPVLRFTILIVDAPPGVGILIDGDGDDDYLASELAQGTGARGGIGVLLDLAGDDNYTAEDRAQGLGTVLGVGVLVDVSGEDDYFLEAEDAHGQGGGFAQRADSGFDDADVPERYYRGTPEGPSIGILVDGAGDDSYRGGQQGFGPTEDSAGEDSAGIALGVLLDLDGQDTYDRPDHEGTTFEDGTCWTSLRPTGDPLNDPPLDTSGELRQRAGTAPGKHGRGVFLDHDGACDVDFVLPPVPDHEEFIEGRQLDASDEDGDGYSRMAEEQVGTNPENEHDYPVGVPQDVPVEEEGVPTGSPWLVRLPGLFVLGDVVDNTYPTCSQEHEALEETTLEFSSVDGAANEVTAAITVPSCEYFVSLDLDGRDTYNNSAGSSIDTMAEASIGGVPSPPTTLSALLLDVGGNDVYDATSRCAQGCGGFLIDLLGNDEYSVRAQGGQGVATSPQGTGLLFDAGGDDTYHAHTDAMAQGSVPSMSSGTGILLDADGADRYNASTQGVSVAAPLQVGAAVPAPAVALFLDLAGVDSYQPVGRQGEATGGLLAAFVDAGGQDKYVGTTGNQGSPDRSAHHNDWMRVTPGGTIQGSPVPTGVTLATSVFLDSGRDDAATLLDASSGQPFRLGPFQIKSDSGSTSHDTYLEDYALLIDPAGDDTYRNNAGATVLRATPSGAGVVYDPAVNYPLASLLIDMAGDDRYVAQIPGFGDGGAPDPHTRGLLAQGAGFLGVGGLFDQAGDDAYSARSQSQGFGLLGWGVLWDQSGDDTYRHDTQQLRRPSVDAGLVVWEQSVAPEQPLDSDAVVNLPVIGNPVQLVVPWSQDGAWNLMVKNVASNPCGATTLGGSTVHGTTVRGGRIATSVFDQDTGFWDLYRINFDGCANLDPDQVSVASSNKINPRFATFLTSNPQERIVWQDDRDGTWSLYHKARDAATTLPDKPLHDAATALAALGSNQTHPDASGGYVVYQDDRAHDGCPAGAWAIYLYYTVNGNEARLSDDCGVHFLPRIAADHVVWQTLVNGSWHVTLYDRQTGTSQVITTGPGDHHSPVVASHPEKGDFILYTSEPEPGQYQVMQYNVETGTSHLVQDNAAQPAIDAVSLDTRAGATWIDTAGDSSSPVASDAWQVRQRYIDATTARGDRVDDDDPDGDDDDDPVSQWLQGASPFGGIGVLFDVAGHDTYRGDAFAQGVSGGPGTGVLVDADGNDVYTIRQGGQGAHIGSLPGHGLLMDVRGNDAYSANGGAQGFSGGTLPTEGGISTPSLSLFVDLGGADTYRYGNLNLLATPLVSGGEPVEDLVGVDLGSSGRNNARWTQGSFGTGVDAPMFEAANRALQSLVEEAFKVTAKVHVGGVAVGEGEKVQGQVEMAANITAKPNGFEVDRVEFFTEYLTNGGDGLTFRGYAQDVTGNLHKRAWETDLYPDGEYRIQVRVHYRHEGAQSALGYVEAEVNVAVNNPPHILNLETGNTSFSPFPFGNTSDPVIQIPGHLEFGFNVTPDPFLFDDVGNPFDAFVAVDIRNDTNQRVFSKVEAVQGGTEWTWDGAGIGTGQDAVPSGEYLVHIRATDLDSPDQDSVNWVDRVNSVSFPVRVYSDTPTAGCVYVPDSQDCNAGAVVNVQANPPTETDGSINFALEFGLATHPGIQDRQYHVFEGVSTDGAINWMRMAVSPDRPHSGPARYTLNIADGSTKHVMVLGEDTMGNLECMPACGVRTNSSVQPDGGALGLGEALNETRDRKLALSGNGTFPANWAQVGGLPVYANFTADLQRPTVGSVGFVVDGERWLNVLDPPRLNGVGDRLQLTYTISDTADMPPGALVKWTNNAVLDQNSFQLVYGPGHVKIQDDIRDTSKALPTYNVTWDDWSTVAAGWPEGPLDVMFNVRDAAGNEAQNAFPATVILDKTRPEMAIRVEYPEGQFHAENGQNVTVFAGGFDPEVAGSSDRGLSWCIDASEATSQEPADEDAWCINSSATSPGDDDPCLLRFRCGGSARVPVDLVGEGDTSLDLVVFVRDSAGNVNQTVKTIAVGVPRLDPHVVQEEPGVRTFNTTWATAVPSNATLQYWTGSVSGEPFLAYSNTSATEHDFELMGLAPGSQYVYRVLATNATDAAARQLSSLRLFQTLHGVRLDLQDPDAPGTISGLHQVRGEAWVLSSTAIQPRVSLRLHGPGLPDAGKVIFDDETEGHAFGLDLVTSALQDGVHRLNATASYLGETVWSETTGLLVDNTAPEVAIVSPAHRRVVGTLPGEVLVRVKEDANPIDVMGARLFIDGVPVATLTDYFPDEDGRFDGVLRFDVDFPDPGRAGQRTLEALVSDVAGNLARASSTLLYDPGLPAAFNASVAYPYGQEAARPGQWITLRVEANDEHTGVARVAANATGLGGGDDAVLTKDGGSHALEIQVPGAQAEGTIHVPLRVQDGAGNVRTTSVPVVVDATPPTLEVVMRATGPETATARLNASEPVTVVLRMQGPGGPVEATSQILRTEHGLDLTALRSATTYGVHVTVRDRAGHDASIEQVWEFLPETTQVPAVRNLTAAVHDGAVHLQWDAPAGQGFRYAVHRAENGTFAVLSTVHATGHVDADALPGMTYRYFVQAVDPRDRHGLASNVVHVFVPAAESGPRVESVAVRPQTGNQETVFVFTAKLRNAEEAAPPAWLILGDGPRRMTPVPGQDCRVECTLQHATRLPAATLRDAAPVFHVEVEDRAGFLRAPALGSLDGPTVLGGSASPDAKDAPSPMPLLALFLAALFLRSRRNQR